MIIRRELKEKAKQQLKGNWGIYIGTSLLLFVISGVASTIIPFAPIILNSVITLSMVYLSMQIYRSEEVDIGKVITYGFQGNILTNLFYYIVMSIYLFLWFLLFIIPAIIKVYSYALTPYIVAEDKEIGINDAITKSRKLMDGYKWKLFVLQLSFIGWGILTALTLGLLWFYVYPYMQQTMYNFYLEVKKEKEYAISE